MNIRLDKLDFYKTHPFTVFEVNKFLSEDFYLKLKNTFPDKNYFVNNQDSTSKETFTSKDLKFTQFLEKNSHWKSFYESIRSDEFIKSAYLLSLKSSFKSRGFKALKIWTLNRQNSILKKLIYRKIDITFNFSRIDTNKKIMPHTDAPSKLFSLIYYFADDNWTEEDGGNTIFWDIKKNFSKWLNWKNLHVQNDNYNDFTKDNFVWHKVTFTKNKLIGFIKSDRSWHSVEDINPKRGNVREVLNIFIRRED
jgi:hypothetical protein